MNFERLTTVNVTALSLVLNGPERDKQTKYRPGPPQHEPSPLSSMPRSSPRQTEAQVLLPPLPFPCSFKEIGTCDVTSVSSAVGSNEGREEETSISTIHNFCRERKNSVFGRHNTEGIKRP